MEVIPKAAQARLKGLPRWGLIEELLSIYPDAQTPDFEGEDDDVLRERIARYIANHHRFPQLASVE